MKSILLSVLIAFALLACGNKNNKGEGKQQNDTVFLRKKLFDTIPIGARDRYYNAIYIDPKQNPYYYNLLADFSLGHFDIETIDRYREDSKKRNIKWPKTNTLDLPAEWLPVFQYQSKYYLYFPSDFGQIMRLKLTDSAFIEWGMEGPWLNIYNSVKKLDSVSYALIVTDRFFAAEGSRQKNIIIHIIDPLTKLAVWEYTNTQNDYRYALYIPKENMHKLPMVVNHSYEKAMEFDFDKTDFAALLAKKTVK